MSDNLPPLPASRSYTWSQVRAYAAQAVADAVDAMQAAVMNGELPAVCEDAVDWMERYEAAIRKGMPC